MEPIHRRRDFLQRASALLLSGTLLGGCAARRPAPPAGAATKHQPAVIDITAPSGHPRRLNRT
ncbi:hypothetical protein WLY07_24145, partial [Bordetella bronchiseptica]